MMINSRRCPLCRIVAPTLVALALGVALGGCGSKGTGSSVSTTAAAANVTATSAAVTSAPRPPTTRPVQPGGATATTAGTGATTGNGAAVQVIMKNGAYDPATVTIKVGDTVTWTNQDTHQHNVVADSGEFFSQPLSEGGTYGFKFTKAGTYPYSCSIHPGETGTVIVR